VVNLENVTLNIQTDGGDLQCIPCDLPHITGTYLVETMSYHEQLSAMFEPNFGERGMSHFHVRKTRGSLCNHGQISLNL